MLCCKSNCLCTSMSIELQKNCIAIHDMIIGKRFCKI